jgi:hypothetical protein
LKITIIWYNEFFNEYIEEGHAMQWPSEKGQNDKQWSTKNYTEN